MWRQHIYAFGAVSPQDGVLDSLDAVEDHLMASLHDFELDSSRIHSINRMAVDY